MSMANKYQNRISGPILDRIDIHLEVQRVPRDKLARLAMIRMAAEHRGLSACAYHRIRKLSHTITDLAGSEGLQQQYLAKALQ